MRNLITVLGWTFATVTIVLILIILVFALVWQKQQNEFAERMMNKAIQQARIEAMELVPVVDKRSFIEKVGNWFRAAIGFIISLLPKV